jgi:hypothetical protein
MGVTFQVLAGIAKRRKKIILADCEPGSQRRFEYHMTHTLIPVDLF